MKIFKIRTVLLAAIAGGAGYVLGTRAGESRYAELKVQADKLRAQADRLARSPQVRETVANVADKVKETAEKTAEKLPDPVADVVTKVTGGSTVAGATADPATPAPSPTTVAPATAAPDPDALEGDGSPRPAV